MKKRILENVITVTVAIGFAMMIGIISKAPLLKLVDMATYTLIIGSIVLIVDDLVERALYNRKLINRIYLLGKLLELMAVALFEAAYMAGTILWMCLFLGGSLGMAIAVCFWGAYCIRTEGFESGEIERLLWLRFRNRIKALPREEAASQLYSFLRFKVVGNTVEGDLDLYNPIDPESFRSIMELSRHEGTEAKVEAGKAYISEILDEYYSRPIKDKR